MQFLRFAVCDLIWKIGSRIEASKSNFGRRKVSSEGTDRRTGIESIELKGSPGIAGQFDEISGSSFGFVLGQF